jgi:drug/metabolite transporter (DMT)-like permease
VALLAPFTLKEPITRLVIAGLLLALLGGVIVALSEACSFGIGGLSCPAPADFFQGEAFLGSALALAGAVLAAMYMILGRRLRASFSLVSYIFLVYGMAAVVLIGIMLVAGYSAFGYPPEAYIWLLLLGLIPQLVGHSSFNWALGYLSAAFVSITLLGEPIGSIILAYLLLNETPSGLEIFGAILILSGILIASQSEKRRNG